MSSSNTSSKNKILILVVDRDNDIGEKANVITPLLGKKNCLEGANQLILADPEEADANTIFAAVSEYDKLIKEGHNCEISVISGDKEEGFKADKKLAKEFDNIQKSYSPKEVFFISDGVNEREIKPIIESRVPIVSIKRVVVKHSKSLEVSYAIFGRYLKSVIFEKKYSRYALGVPGILILLYGFLTYFDLAREGLLITTLIIGITAIIRGFDLDKMLSQISNPSKNLTLRGYLRLFSTLTSILIIVVGIIQGYTKLTNTYEYELLVSNPNAVLNYGSILFGVFISNSMNLIWLGIGLSFLATILYNRVERNITTGRAVIGIITLLLFYIPIREFALLLTGKGNPITLIAYILIGLAASAVVLPIIYKYVRSKRKRRIKQK